MKKSVLMKASFEKTSHQLFDSAIQCKADPIRGVSENIIMGTLAPIGTGIFKICYDDTVKKDDKQKDIGQKSTHQKSVKSPISDDLIFDGIN